MRKGIITLGVVAVVVLVAMSLGPVAVNLLTNRGLQTASLDTGGEPATIGVDGTWEVVRGAGRNFSQAGYTFGEKLPSARKTTSGRTDNSHDKNIVGEVKVRNGVMTEAVVKVDVASISSDVEKRDINVRRKILLTDKHPRAEFTLTKPVRVSQIPKNGTVDTIKVRGDLQLVGKRRPVAAEFKVLRTGENVLLEAHVPFKRSAFGIETGQFVASKIDDEGTIDLLLVLARKK